MEAAAWGGHVTAGYANLKSGPAMDRPSGNFIDRAVKKQAGVQREPSPGSLADPNQPRAGSISNLKRPSSARGSRGMVRGTPAFGGGAFNRDSHNSGSNGSAGRRPDSARGSAPRTMGDLGGGLANNVRRGTPGPNYAGAVQPARGTPGPNYAANNANAGATHSFRPNN